MSVQRRFFLKLSVAFPSLYLSGPLVAAVTSPDPLEAMLGGSEALCMIGSLYLQAKPGVWIGVQAQAIALLHLSH